MKHYLTNDSGAFVCVDTTAKTLLKVFYGTITFEPSVDSQWQLDWHLRHDYYQTSKEEFDEFYKEQVELLNSIVSC